MRNLKRVLIILIISYIFIQGSLDLDFELHMNTAIPLVHMGQNRYSASIWFRDFEVDLNFKEKKRMITGIRSNIYENLDESPGPEYYSLLSRDRKYGLKENEELHGYTYHTFGIFTWDRRFVFKIIYDKYNKPKHLLYHYFSE